MWRWGGSLHAITRTEIAAPTYLARTQYQLLVQKYILYAFDLYVFLSRTVVMYRVRTLLTRHRHIIFTLSSQPARVVDEQGDIFFLGMKYLVWNSTCAHTILVHACVDVCIGIWSTRFRGVICAVSVVSFPATNYYAARQLCNHNKFHVFFING